MGLKAFDRKFGTELLRELPAEPAVYLFKDEEERVLYVGQSSNIRRRLRDYRNASRRKAHRKMRALVREAHALEIRLFGTQLFAYHVVNVLIHALNAVLLVVLLARSRIPLPFALLGVAWFAVHPANVEAVAWLFQLKTVAGLAFVLGALLTLRRHPLVASGLFALALLTKAATAFALPMAAALCWAWSAADPPGSARRRWLPIGLWAVLLPLVCLPLIRTWRREAEAHP